MPTLHQISTGINSACETVERSLNVVTCVPVLGVFGVVARIKMGQVQAVCGAALAVFAAIGYAASAHPQDKEVFKKVAVLGGEHAIHGCLNVIKGFNEALLTILTFGLGNPIMLLWRVPNKFSPHFEYGAFSGVPSRPLFA